MVSEKNSGSPRDQSRSRSHSPSHSDSEGEENQRRSVSKTREEEIVAESNEVIQPAITNKSTDESIDKKVKEHSRSRSKSVSSSENSKNSKSRSRSRRRHNERRRNNSNDRSKRHRRRNSRSRSNSRSPRRTSRSRSRGYKRSGRRDSRDRYSRNKRYSRTITRSRSRSPSPYYRRLNPSPCRVLGVFGLNFQTDDRDLKRVFEKYGRLDKVKLVTDPRTGRSRGFAFIYYQNVEDAEEAKDRIHGSEIDGNHVRVEYSISNREHNPTPGVYMGRRTATSSRYDDRDEDYNSTKRGHYSRSRSRSRSFEKRRRSYSRDY